MLDIFKSAERLMTMDDDAWARHSNPWSVYTRFTCLPLIVLAIWSRVWLGWWSVLPLVLALAWTWINPRLFDPPKSKDHWATKGVLGERIFLARKEVPIADHHIRMAHTLTAMSALGMVVLVWGLVMLNAWATIFGMTLAILTKLWFVDRMVWIFEDTEPGTG